ncbi:MAG TPA: tetratricopeptide repeat protein [Steroidobacteraceae bacterium]|nr:tetratricopeptide repeat protein [Steroidobacteraceae bacterium]
MPEVTASKWPRIRADRWPEGSILSRVICLILLSGLLCACRSLLAPPPFPQPAGQTQSAPGSAAPQAPQPGEPAQAAPPAAAARPAPREFRLGPASTALVTQAHGQLSGGDFALAAATIERAMRIEPDNPLLWIELGRVRLTAGDNAQADSMGRKALALATGDPRAQSQAWRLIADSLRALRRTQEAAEADQRADSLAAR